MSNDLDYEVEGSSLLTPVRLVPAVRLGWENDYLDNNTSNTNNNTNNNTNIYKNESNNSYPFISNDTFSSLRLDSESSAFRRLESPTAKTPIRDNNNSSSSREVFTPGIEITPGSNNFLRSTVGKELRDKNVNYNDINQLSQLSLGGFDNHPKPYQSYDGNDDSHLSIHKSSSPDFIVGMVSQLVNKQITPNLVGDDMGLSAVSRSIEGMFPLPRDSTHVRSFDEDAFGKSRLNRTIGNPNPLISSNDSNLSRLSNGSSRYSSYISDTDEDFLPPPPPYSMAGQSFNDNVLRTSAERLNVRTSREFDNPPYLQYNKSIDSDGYDNNLFPRGNVFDNGPPQYSPRNSIPPSNPMHSNIQGRPQAFPYQAQSQYQQQQQQLHSQSSNFYPSPRNSNEYNQRSMDRLSINVDSQVSGMQNNYSSNQNTNGFSQFIPQQRQMSDSSLSFSQQQNQYVQQQHLFQSSRDNNNMSLDPNSAFNVRSNSSSGSNTSVGPQQSRNANFNNSVMNDYAFQQQQNIQNSKHQQIQQQQQYNYQQQQQHLHQQQQQQMQQQQQLQMQQQHFQQQQQQQLIQLQRQQPFRRPQQQQQIQQNAPLRSQQHQMAQHLSQQQNQSYTYARGGSQMSDNHSINSLTHSIESISSHGSSNNKKSHSQSSKGHGKANNFSTVVIGLPTQPVNRQELVESPRSKNAYKDFYKHLRIKERESVESASLFAENALQYMPEKTKWRVYLELGDLAKRHNDFEKARNLYNEACRLQPIAPQCWLEWSRMEEECGNLKESLKILQDGLAKCTFNEGLLTKAVKQLERLHKMEDARKMLSVLKHESIDRVWKAVLEGALLEARAGRSPIARKFFKYLIENVPWYGPIYYEAYKLEEKDGNERQALEIIRKGLAALPRYGPLWLGLMKIVERQDFKDERRRWFSGGRPQLNRLREESFRATRSISRELVWKVHFELAQAEERAAEIAAVGLHYLSASPLLVARNELLSNARLSLVKSLITCPANLRWKVLLAGSRLELDAGSLSKARKLLCRAFAESPPKSKSCVYLECSRVEEYAGNINGARRILTRAREEMRGEWKIFLETSLLEARAGNVKGAVVAATEALKHHSGTGRLWAILVQMCHRLETTLPKSQLGVSSQFTKNIEGQRVEVDGSMFDYSELEAAIFRRNGKKINPNGHNAFVIEDDDFPIPTKHEVLLLALGEVPKSGEVWCEGARCHLNPMHLPSFDLGKAQRFLCFAIQFTPQYGDSFIEYLRVEMLCQVLLPKVLAILGIPIVPFLKRFLHEDIEADTVSILQDYGLLQGLCAEPMASPAPPFERQKRRQLLIGLERMEVDLGQLEEAYKLIAKKSIERRCINADPNYGTAWFYCRPRPFDTPSFILNSATNILSHELSSAQKLYARAIVHYVQKVFTIVKNVPSPLSKSPKRPSSAPSKRPDVKDDDSKVTTSMDGATAVLALGLGNAQSNSKSKFNGDGELEALLEAQEDGIDQSQRDEEFLSDFTLSHSMIENWPSPVDAQSLSLLEVDGKLFASTDFVSSLVQLNRIVFNRNLSEEDRRRVLFGSDQIIP